MSKAQNNSGRYDEPKTSPIIKIVLILVAVAIVCVATYSILDATGTLRRMATAYTVGESDITAMDMNLYYYDVRSNILNESGSILQLYGYTLDASLDYQLCAFDQTITWREYFMQSAQAQAQQVEIMYAEGQKAGYVMTEDDLEGLELYMESVADAAESNDLSPAKYVSAVYGSGTKLSDVRRHYEKRFYVAGYYEQMIGSYTFTDAELDAYYQENRTTYDLADAYYHSFTYQTYTYDADATPGEGVPTSEEDATRMTEESRAEAEAKANRVIAASDFDATVLTELDEGVSFESALRTGISLTATDVRTTWLADEARTAGDAEVLDDESNNAYIAVRFVSRYRDDAQAASVRHILLQTQTAADDATDEEVAAVMAANEQVKADIEALYEEWKNGDATEESFAALATERTEDTGSRAEGGLYEHFSEGTMVDAFNDWSFDSARTYGDTNIVETDYGYHLMYFVSADGDYADYAILEALESETYGDWYDSLTEGYPATVHSFGTGLVA